MGLRAALWGEIAIENGRITTTHFDRYPIARVGRCSDCSARPGCGLLRDAGVHVELTADCARKRAAAEPERAARLSVQIETITQLDTEGDIVPANGGADARFAGAIKTRLGYAIVAAAVA